MPGIKIVACSTPTNAKGLMKAAIRDNNPVLFFEHVLLYNLREELPTGDYICALDQADIISFIIKKEFRRKKYGTILFTRFVNYLKTKGVERIFLEVSKKNIPALKFYFCIGFERVGYRKNYYKNINGNVDADVLMSSIDSIINKESSLIL